MKKNKDAILVIIAARGGSKGIKDKNIMTLVDRPLIAYTILQAAAWGKGRRIVCSTDSRKIAVLAQKYGAEVPFMRPAHLAGDNVSKVAVLRHALTACERIYQERYDVIIDLDATAPVRMISDLENALRLFLKRRPKTLLSGVRSRKNPYFNMVERGAGGTISLCKRLKRPVVTRQSAPEVFDLNASLYIYARSYLIDKKNRSPISDNSILYEMSEISAFDIDANIDFLIVKNLLKEGMWNSEI